MEAARKGDFYVMASQKKRIYTIADIEALPEGQRAELIDGRMYMMATPSLNHQDILVWLSVRIFNFIESHKGKCRVVPAPFGVFIKKDDRNYFEPDISVICDRDKLNEKGCNGAPDWIIEIVSPSTERMDYGVKLFKYRSAGVREYWIINPRTRTVNVFDFEHDQESAQYCFEDEIPVCIYADLTIRISDLF